MRTAPALAVAALSAACLHAPPALAWGSVQGDGNKVTESRSLPPFARVKLLTSLGVEVTEGPAQEVSVTLDANLLPLLETRVEGDTLVIGSRRNLRYRGKGEVRIAVPVLRGFAIEGSGDVRIAGADAARDLELAIGGSGDLAWSGKAGAVRVAVDGSGDVRLSGAAESLTVGISGSGDVDAAALRAKSAHLSVSGSGDVKAALDGGALAAAVEGSGDIEWTGTAQVQSAAVSGSGSIRHR